jgi:hypothetical protein
LTKGNGHFMCHGKQIKRTNQQTVVGVGEGGWGNSSSKACDISFADRPKAKRLIHYRIVC